MPAKKKDEFRIKRSYSPYVIRTWEKFRISEHLEIELDGIIHTNAELKECVSKLKKQYKAVFFKSLIQKHLMKNNSNEVTKKSLSCLFRAFGAKILPTRLFGSVLNQRIFIRNMNVLFMAGRGTSIWASDMLNSMNLLSMTWLKCDHDREILLKLIVWIGEHIFWRLLKSFFHVSEKASGRNEIFFYQKRDFQRLVHKTFSALTKEDKLKSIDSLFREKMLKKFAFTPVTSKCRILPKKSLDSFRIVCRNDKLQSLNGGTEDLSDLRLILTYAAENLFPNMVDVKGKTFSQKYCIPKNR